MPAIVLDRSELKCHYTYSSWTHTAAGHIMQFFLNIQIWWPSGFPSGNLCMSLFYLSLLWMDRHTSQYSTYSNSVELSLVGVGQFFYLVWDLRYLICDHTIIGPLRTDFLGADWDIFYWTENKLGLSPNQLDQKAGQTFIKLWETCG